MPFAIERGVTVTAEPAERFEVEALDLGETDAFDAPSPVHGWKAFARGIVAELRAAGFEVEPAQARRSPATSRRAAGCPPPPRWRPRWRWPCWARRRRT